jgi:PIN domain nuclease of toxin-antitoxin system
MTLISDTHPVVWHLADSPRLSPAAHQALRDPDAKIVIPTIVLAEIHYLHARRRIAVDLTAALSLIHTAANCRIHPLDEAVVARLPSSLSIHDAIIVATALVHRDDLGENVALITEDAEITATGLIPIIW